MGKQATAALHSERVLRTGSSVGRLRVGQLFVALAVTSALLLVPATPVAAEMPSGNQLVLDGNNDRATVADNATLDLGDTVGEDFTLEAFVYFPYHENVIWAADGIFGKGGAYSLRRVTQQDLTDNLVFSYFTPFGGTGQLIYNAGIIRDSVSRHIAVVFDDEVTASQDRLAMYFDGARVAGGLVPDLQLRDSDQPLFVGWDDGWEYWGAIDEARISDTARYSGASYTVPAAPFVDDAATRALWHFDDDVAGGRACATTFVDASGNGNTLVGVSDAKTGIRDAPPPTLELSSKEFTVGEADGSAEITIMRRGDPLPAVRVDHRTKSGTATEGLDHTDTDGSVSFACGETTKTFSVPIELDEETEREETVLLTLDAPTGGASLGDPFQATLTILDADNAPNDVQGLAQPAERDLPGSLMWLLTIVLAVAFVIGAMYAFGRRQGRGWVLRRRR